MGYGTTTGEPNCQARELGCIKLGLRSYISRGETGNLLAMLANEVCRRVGIELTNRREGHIAHHGVAEFGGEDTKAGCARRLVVARDHLGEYLAAETGHIGGLSASVRAGHGLPADHVERTDWDAMPCAESVETRIFVQQAGQQPGREVGAIGLVEKAAPGIGVKAASAFAEGGMLVCAFGDE